MRRLAINKTKFFVGSRRGRRHPFNSSIADRPNGGTFSAIALSFLCAVWRVAPPVFGL
jgi:hypothetical protein